MLLSAGKARILTSHTKNRRKEAIVHARVVSMEMLPINVGEAVRIYQDRVVPAARDQEGFRGALMLTDPDTGEGLSISMWNTEDDMHASEASGYYHRKLSELDALFISTPVRKHYEVSAQE
jgi:heme-degrading monooxygenase HmoA